MRENLGAPVDLDGAAAALDDADPLAHLRGRYHLDERVVYLDGNSLGPPATVVAARVASVVADEWGRRLIGSWADGWWDAPERVGELIAPLIGAAPGQVVVADSTSVDIFKLLVGGVRLRQGRHELVIDADTFPTDRYIADSVAELMGLTVGALPLDDLAGRVGAGTAVVLANHVDYRTGRLHDLAAITRTAHDAGALVLADLSHSVGALPVHLDADGVDLAVGCGYKFLGGGPGAPAFSYVRRDLQARFRTPLPGWGGHREPFAMAAGYQPVEGIGRLRSGTPDILSLLTLEAALSVWDGVLIDDVRAKSLSLTAFFVRCVDALIPADAARVVTPRGDSRGSQVSLACADAEQVISRLIDRGVIGDYRPPDLLRFGFAPLYTRHVDALAAARTLRSLL